MPGFMMHIAEGQLILNKLNIIDKSYTNSFLCGAILPDATSDKEKTHFRPSWQNRLITKFPDMEYIQNKYCKIISSPYDIGILAHLHLDHLFVSSYWEKYFVFEDSNNSRTVVDDDIHHVRLLKNNSIIPYNEFFTPKYFYGEYDIINPFIFRDIITYIPSYTDISRNDIHIDECLDYDKDILMTSITKHIKKDACTDLPETKIFPYDSILSFLDVAAEMFIKLIKQQKLL